MKQPFIYLSSLLVLLLVQGSAVAADASEPLFQTSVSGVGSDAGCTIQHSLAMRAETELVWQTTSVCNGEITRNEATRFAGPSIRTLIYLLGKAADMSEQAASYDDLARHELFTWDERIVFSVVAKPETGYGVELADSSRGMGQSSTLVIPMQADQMHPVMDLARALQDYVI